MKYLIFIAVILMGCQKSIPTPQTQRTANPVINVDQSHLLVIVPANKSATYDYLIKESRLTEEWVIDIQALMMRQGYVSSIASTNGSYIKLAPSDKNTMFIIDGGTVDTSAAPPMKYYLYNL